MKHIPRRKPLATIIVTPLVDVVLVLLVLFLVIKPLMARSIDVREPHATVKVPDEDRVPAGQLVVQAHPEGLWLNSEAIAPEELTERLRSELLQRSASVVFFQGHADLNYGVAVHYLDLIRASGAEILGIAPALEVVPQANDPGTPGEQGNEQ